MTTVTLLDGRTVNVLDLGGLAEVARHYGWNPSTLTTWVNRYKSCPKPVLILSRGAIYHIPDWDGWNPGGETYDANAA
jgi:hypothetical protein